MKKNSQVSMSSNLPQIEILYEDAHVVVINKPAGLIVHADGRTTEPTVVDWILKKYGEEIKEVGEPLHIRAGQPAEEIIYRPGIVHRLDRETSGVLAIAKDQESFLNLKQQFKDRETAKTYLAFVYGEIKEKEGTINRPIGKSTRDFRMWSAQRGAKGELREAVTDYKVLEATEGLHQDGFSYVEVHPKTGRTHQIRVHFKAINCPVVCDSLYAPKRKPALGFKRLALHAKILEFADFDGKKVMIEAPLPEDFKRGLEEIKKMIEVAK